MFTATSSCLFLLAVTLSQVAANCGPGYVRVLGQYQDVPFWGSVGGRGGGEVVGSCDECAALCDTQFHKERGICMSYECNPDADIKQCNLNVELVPTAPKHEDFIFCAKSTSTKALVFQIKPEAQSAPNDCSGVFLPVLETLNDRQVWVDHEKSRFLGWNGISWAIGRANSLEISLGITPLNPEDSLTFSSIYTNQGEDHRTGWRSCIVEEIPQYAVGVQAKPGREHVVDVEGVYRLTAALNNDREEYINDVSGCRLSWNREVGRWAIRTSEEADPTHSSTGGRIDGDWEDLDVWVIGHFSFGLTANSQAPHSTGSEDLFELSEHIYNGREVYIDSQADSVIAFSSTLGSWVLSSLRWVGREALTESSLLAMLDDVHDGSSTLYSGWRRYDLASINESPIFSVPELDQSNLNNLSDQFSENLQDLLDSLQLEDPAPIANQTDLIDRLGQHAGQLEVLEDALDLDCLLGMVEC